MILHYSVQVPQFLPRSRYTSRGILDKHNDKCSVFIKAFGPLLDIHRSTMVCLLELFIQNLSSLHFFFSSSTVTILIIQVIRKIWKSTVNPNWRFYTMTLLYWNHIMLIKLLKFSKTSQRTFYATYRVANINTAGSQSLLRF